MRRITGRNRRGRNIPASEAALRGSGAPASNEIGVVSYFHIHDASTVERVVAGVEKMGITRLRTAVSWCDWETDGGPEWYEWVLEQLCSRFSVLPCILYTPPAKGMLPKTSSPPRDPNDYADFVDLLLSTYPDRFEYVELWNEPNNYVEWDWTLDPDWSIFTEMIAAASARAHDHGVKTVFGGMSPLDPNWLNLMFLRGAMQQMDVVGIHGFPGSWDALWEGWSGRVQRVQEVLDRHSSEAEVWITECGFSTWTGHELRQIESLVEVMDAPVPRAYWYSAEDLDIARATLDGFHADERAYHFGLHRRGGEPKLAARVWASGGAGGLRTINDLGSRDAAPSRGAPATLVAGGAGKIGAALVDRLVRRGRDVVVLDDLSRPGSEQALLNLHQKHGDRLGAEIGDIRDPAAVRRALAGCDEVFHLAAPAPALVLTDPLLDLSVNLDGTMKLLEEMRRLEQPTPILFASTLEVYEPARDLRPISESHPLALYEAEVRAKATAEQYVLQYGSGYGFPAVVFRLGLVVGPDDPTSAFAETRAGGVRDVLGLDDAVEALMMGMENYEVLAGKAYNIGGGAGNVIDLGSSGEEPRNFIADSSAFSAITGWKPRRLEREALAVPPA